MAKKLSPVAQKALDFYLSKSQESSNEIYQKIKAAFTENPFPSTKDEDWQYTRLTGFLGHHFEQKLAGDFASNDVDLDAWMPEFSSIKIVFINGEFSAACSDDLANLPAALRIEVSQDLDQLESQVSVNDNFWSEPMAIFNALNARSGLKIYANKNVDQPVYILNVITESNALAANSHQVTIAENAELTLIENFVTTTDEVACCTSNTDIAIAKHGRLQQVVMQGLNEKSFYFKNQFIHQAQASSLNTFFTSLGANVSRHQNHLLMDGERIESIQNSACIATGKQTVDSRTNTTHKDVAGLSRQLHKFVLDRQAVGVFNGMIGVDQKAQQTDGQMDNKNLVLSNQARMNTKPQLEIYADDVACSHGSATGQIDENQVFYLQARGISKATAIQMITQAFVLEPLEQIHVNEIKHWVEQAVTKRLAQVQKG